MAIDFNPANVEQMTDESSTPYCRDKNCVVCSLLTAVKLASAARWANHGDPKVTPGELRTRSGVSCYVGTGGVNFDAAARAIDEATNGEVKFNVRYWLTRQQARDAVATGHPTIWVLHYYKVLGTPYASDAYFGGTHAVAVLRKRWNTKRHREEGLVGDPLADGRMMPNGRRAREDLVWWPMHLLYDAAEGPSAPDSPSIHIMAGPDIVNATKVVVADGAPVRSGPSPDSPKVAQYPAGRKVYVRNVVSGGEWHHGGRSGRAWWQFHDKDGRVLYTPGSRLRAA